MNYKQIYKYVINALFLRHKDKKTVSIRGDALKGQDTEGSFGLLQYQILFG